MRKIIIIQVFAVYLHILYVILSIILKEGQARARGPWPCPWTVFYVHEGRGWVGRTA